MLHVVRQQAQPKLTLVAGPVALDSRFRGNDKVAGAWTVEREVRNGLRNAGYKPREVVVVRFRRAVWEGREMRDEQVRRFEEIQNRLAKLRGRL